jgi:hypothetical protein
MSLLNNAAADKKGQSTGEKVATTRGSTEGKSWLDNKDHVMGALVAVGFGTCLYLIMCAASGRVHPIQQGATSLVQHKESIQHWLDIALLTFGIVCGWMAGTVLAPSAAKESDRFVKVSTAVGTFITGLVLSKVGGIVEVVTKPVFWTVTNQFRLLMWLSGLGIAVMVTYVIRAYLFPSFLDAELPLAIDSTKTLASTELAANGTAATTSTRLPDSGPGKPTSSKPIANGYTEHKFEVIQGR